jgi:hypothetical protein
MMLHCFLLQTACPRNTIGIPPFPLLGGGPLLCLWLPSLIISQRHTRPNTCPSTFNIVLFLAEVAPCCHRPTVPSSGQYVPPTMALFGAYLL